MASAGERSASILAMPSIYDAERFKGVSLRPGAIELMHQSPTNLDRLFLNRLLVEDAYPLELSKIQFAFDRDPGFAWLTKPSVVLLELNYMLFFSVCLPALIAALAFRRGLTLLLTGVVFVRRDGAPASRARLLWRALVTWSLFMAAAALSGYSCRESVGPALAFGLFCTLALFSVELPQHGLQDRLAGTWPVMR